MRAFSDSFRTAIERDHLSVFWSASVFFPSGTRYVVGAHPLAADPVVIGGNTHEQVVVSWGALSSALDHAPHRFDVQEFTLVFNNFLTLETGGRWSDLWAGALDRVRTEFFLNAVTEDGTVEQFSWVAGVMNASRGYSVAIAAHNVRALSELYLERNAAPVLSSLDYPNIRPGDDGATLPIPIGVVERAPGRVLNTGHPVSVPQPGPANAGTAALASVLVDSSVNAPVGDWLLRFRSEETHQQVATNGKAEVGRVPTAVTFGNQTNTTASGVSSHAFNHNSNGSLLVVSVGMNWLSVISSITAGGVAMKAKVTQARTAIYYLEAPPQGTISIVITFTGSAQMAATAHSLITAASAAYAAAPVDSGDNLAAVAVDSSVQDRLLARAAKDNSGGGLTAGSAQLPVQGGATVGGSGTSGVITASSRAVPDTDGQTTLSYSSSGGQRVYMTTLVAPGTPEVFGQRIRTAGTQTLTGVRLLLERNAAFVGTGAGTYRVDIEGNASGLPNGVTHRAVVAQLAGTGAQWVTVPLPEFVLTGGTSYHITLRAASDKDGRGAVFWHRHNAGAYADGEAVSGTAADTYFRNTAMPFSKGTWAVVAGQDMAFELVLKAGVYDVTGPTGAQGSGNTGADFTSDNGVISIPKAHWSGAPSGGDVVTWRTIRENARVAFGYAGRGVGTAGIKAVGEVYLDGNPLSAAQPRTQTQDDTFFILGSTITTPGQRLAFVLPLPSGGFIGNNSLELKLRKQGAPTKPVVVDLCENANGAPGNIIVTGSIAASAISAVGATFVPLPLTVGALVGGSPVVVVRTQQAGTTTDRYEFHMTNVAEVDPETELLSWTDATPRWVETGRDPTYRFTPAAVTKSTSLEGPPHRFAGIALAASIPDGVVITADVEGWMDDTAGTVTGVAGGVITRPDAFFHAALLEAGAMAADIALDKFAKARVGYGTVYRFNGLIGADAPVTWKEAILAAAFQCRTTFSWVDRASIVFLPGGSTTPALDRELRYGDMIANEVGLPDCELRYDGPVINAIDLRWRREWGKGESDPGAYRTHSVRNPPSMTDYGEKRDDALFVAPLITNATAAADLAEFWLVWFARPPRVLETRLPLRQFAIEQGDVIAPNLLNEEMGGTLPLALPATLGDVFDGLDGSRAFLVLQEDLELGTPPEGDEGGQPPYLRVVAREV